jgi:hypothetical protein
MEIWAWPAAPHWALLVNGAFAGFWAGLFFCSGGSSGVGSESSSSRTV